MHIEDKRVADTHIEDKHSADAHIEATDTLLFIGDSITDAGRDRTDSASLGSGYVHEIARTLQGRASGGPGPTVINKGLNGNRVYDLEARWTTDVIDHMPTVVTVKIGINDTWRRYDSGLASPVDEFEECLDRLLAETTRQLSARLVVITPFLLPVSADQEDWFEDLTPVPKPSSVPRRPTGPNWSARTSRSAVPPSSTRPRSWRGTAFIRALPATGSSPMPGSPRSTPPRLPWTCDGRSVGGAADPGPSPTRRAGEAHLHIHRLRTSVDLCRTADAQGAGRVDGQFADDVAALMEVETDVVQVGHAVVERHGGHVTGPDGGNRREVEPRWAGHPGERARVTLRLEGLVRSPHLDGHRAVRRRLDR